MDPSQSFGIGGTIVSIVLFVLAFVYAVLTLCLPFIVYGILRQAKRSNELLHQSLVAFTAVSAQLREADKHAKDAVYQAELTVAALQRIKDSSDTVAQHAVYQTEVTKHRLALEAQAVG